MERVRPTLPLIGALLAAILLGAAAALAQVSTAGVEAQLSAVEVGAGEPVELTLTATSAGGEVSPPDLGPIEHGFEILDRRIERQMSVVNGERRERVRLRLLLMPRQTGEIEVPAVTFGAAASRPLTLRVSAGAEGPLTAPDPGNPATGWSPPPSVWAGPPVWPDPLATPIPPPLPWADPTVSVPGAIRSEPPAPEPTPPGALARTLRDPWFWAALVLAVGLWWSLRRRRVQSGSAPPPAAVPATSPEPDPLAEVLTRVGTAYASGNAGAAREALLAWGRLRWPEDPPGNLARLAQRCPADLAAAIQQLEKAFFSPTPIPWQESGVAEAIGRMDPPAAQPSPATEGAP